MKKFYGHSFRLHGIIPSLQFQLGGKTMLVEVKVVDVPIDYIFLLVRNWIYSMKEIMLFVFLVICFPHEGIIVMIDQLSLDHY